MCTPSYIHTTYPYYYVSYHTYVARYVRMYVVKYVPTYVSTYVMYESLLIMMYYKKEFQSSPYLEESLEAESFPFLKVGSHNATSRISWYKILYPGYGVFYRDFFILFC